MPFLRLIDRYILGELLKPFLAGVVAFMIIMISNTLYIFMELIIKSNVDIGTVMRMLAFNLPAIVVVTLPVAYMFATLLALGRLGRDSEIIALQAAGISLTRVIAPIILVAILISGLGWLLQEKVVPWSNRQTVEILKDMMKRDTLQAIKEKHFLNTDNRSFYVQSIDRKNNLLKGIYVLDRSRGGQPQVITAETGARQGSKWVLYQGILRKLDPQGFIDHEIRFERMEIEMDIKPEMIFNDELDVRRLAAGEAAKLIEEKRKRGEDTRRDEMDYHTKFSLPLATFFTILLATPIGIRFSKMGNYFGVAISIALVFIWYLAYSTFTNLGAVGTVHPVLAAWIQNLVFGLVGILLLLQMQGVKIFTIFFWPLLMLLRPFREAIRGRPLSKDPDDKPHRMVASVQERSLAALLHLSAWLAFGILPLLVWWSQRRRSDFLRLHSREIFNFQLSLLLYVVLEVLFILGLAWIFLVQTFIPLPPLPLVLTSEHFALSGLGLVGFTSLFAAVASVSASLQAWKSQAYHYPLALAFIREPHRPSKQHTHPISAYPTTPLGAPEAPQTTFDAKTGQEMVASLEPLQIHQLSSSWNWRRIWVTAEADLGIRVRQRGGIFAFATLLFMSLLSLGAMGVIYDQTQTLQLRFYCQQTPQAGCIFEEQALLRVHRRLVPVTEIRDVRVIPRELHSPGNPPRQIFDLVLHTQQREIWISSQTEEAKAHVLASQIRLFAQGFVAQTAPIAQMRIQSLLVFASVWLLGNLLLWLLWPRRWRREFSLNTECLRIHRGRRILPYPRQALGEWVIEPGWWHRQDLMISWTDTSHQRQHLLLATGLKEAQIQALLQILQPWLEEMKKSKDLHQPPQQESR